MMEETGIVLSVEGKDAKLRFERTDACKKCGACQLGQDGQMSLIVPNTLDAKPGDRVAVSLGEAQVLKASLLAYGFPLVGLIAGMLLGWFAAPLVPGLPQDVCAVIGAALLTLAAFLVNRALEPARRRKAAYQPRVVRIEEDESQGGI